MLRLGSQSLNPCATRLRSKRSVSIPYQAINMSGTDTTALYQTLGTVAINFEETEYTRMSPTRETEWVSDFRMLDVGDRVIFKNRRWPHEVTTTGTVDEWDGDSFHILYRVETTLARKDGADGRLEIVESHKDESVTEIQRQAPSQRSVATRCAGIKRVLGES